MNTLEQIGQRIRQTRRAQDMTQTSLAKKLGCNRVNVSLWESGTNGMKLEKLPSLCRALKTSSDYLLGLAKR